MLTLPRDTSPDVLGIVWAVAGWKPRVGAKFAEFAEYSEYEESLLYFLSGRYSDQGVNVSGRRQYGGRYYDPVVVPAPDLHQHLAWPPGYKQPDPQLDGSVVALLHGLLLEQKTGGGVSNASWQCDGFCVQVDRRRRGIPRGGVGARREGLVAALYPRQGMGLLGA